MDNVEDNLLITAAELIKDRFFFISLRNKQCPKSTSCTHYFSIDQELCYDKFFHDFGPLNIAMLYNYCGMVNRKLKLPALQKKRIVHYTNCCEEKRVNAAYLACSYMIIYHNFSPEHVNDLLSIDMYESFINFRDASKGIPFTISLQDCLDAIYKARNVGMFNFDDFDCLEYEHYEKVENGDLNWIVPGKLIGFCGPQNQAIIDNGYPIHSPETYFSYFRRHGVTTIVRLNEKLYEASKFTKAGFIHKDLYFVDGSTPNDKILKIFLSICENTTGAVAIHCKAGLGRTGTLIGSYIMKHYKFTAHEAIAWVRICRPGSIIGHQQAWMQIKQEMLWEAGAEYRTKSNTVVPSKHLKGIYSYNHKVKNLKRIASVGGILEKVDTMQLEDQDLIEENSRLEPLTQGDHLNRIKAQRRSQRVTVNERKTYARVLASPLDSASVLRGGKVIGQSAKHPAVPSRVIAKRNERKSHSKIYGTPLACASVLRGGKIRQTVKHPAVPSRVVAGSARTAYVNKDGTKHRRVDSRKTMPKKSPLSTSSKLVYRSQLKSVKVSCSSTNKTIIQYKENVPNRLQSKVIKCSKVKLDKKSANVYRSVKVLK